MKAAPPELLTDRLRLRQFESSDIDAYAALCADPEVMEFLGGPLSREDAWRQMAFFRGHWAFRGYGLYAVEERATGEMVGRVGYLNPEGWPGFEVGWTLRRSAWGRGFATEAAAAAIDQAFNHMDADVIISLIAPGNAGSIRVAERLGEKITGQWAVRGIPVNIHSLSKVEWLASQ
jgi:RimJ/RimL family protein N-acetyltransferase